MASLLETQGKWSSASKFQESSRLLCSGRGSTPSSRSFRSLARSSGGKAFITSFFVQSQIGFCQHCFGSGQNIYSRNWGETVVDIKLPLNKLLCVRTMFFFTWFCGSSHAVDGDSRWRAVPEHMDLLLELNYPFIDVVIFLPNSLCGLLGRQNNKTFAGHRLSGLPGLSGTALELRAKSSSSPVPLTTRHWGTFLRIQCLNRKQPLSIGFWYLIYW